VTDAIPAAFRDLFSKKVYAHLATVMPDGRPQVTPVWCEFDGKHVLINTAVGRRKDRNMQRDGRVSMSLIDPDNAYRYLEVRGKVVERTENGANDDINRLSMKYLGKPYPFMQPGERRVTYRIAPEHATSMG
jgi:PPOX class probable F420-dependent enzyme